jgi:SAM-dependent methyltransferase
MDVVRPADFYTGIVAEVYGPLRSHVPDPDPYARFIERAGQPALELGCGDGDPLLDLRRLGLDVDGLDASADMLARARARADEAGIVVALHHSTIEAMELPRRYRAIFLAGPTFNLIADDDTAWHALDRIREHLEPDGRALIPLYVPAPTPGSQLGQPRTEVADDGRTLRCTILREERDEQRRQQTAMLRYELEEPDGGTLVTDERFWVLHWHTREGFRALAAEAGLRVRSERSMSTDAWTVILERDPDWDRPRTSRPTTPGRAVLAAGMLGLDQAIYGERPKVQVVAEAEADGLDLGDVELDLDDPKASRIRLDDP